ncbi:MAG: hypothetical protein ABR985_00600 [Methanotrichaceae archaeon]
MKSPNTFYRKIQYVERSGTAEICVPKPIADLWAAKGCSNVRITVSKGDRLIVEAV